MQHANIFGYKNIETSKKALAKVITLFCSATAALYFKM